MRDSIDEWREEVNVLSEIIIKSCGNGWQATRGKLKAAVSTDHAGRRFTAKSVKEKKRTVVGWI